MMKKSTTGVRIARVLQTKRKQVKTNLNLSSLVEADRKIATMIDKALKGMIQG